MRRTGVRRLSFGFYLIFVLLLAPACVAHKSRPEWSRKLELQWQKYDDGRELLLKSVARPLQGDEPPISREVWEATLALSETDAWTSQDLEDLKRDQARRIQESRLKAAKQSSINLEDVRRLGKVGRFCELLPKGGMLHFHPWGAVARDTADRLLESRNPTLSLGDVFKSIQRSHGNSLLYPDEEAWLKSLPNGVRYLSLASSERRRFQSFLFLPPGKQPFPRFNSTFLFIGFALPDGAAVHQAMRDMAVRAARQGVIYIEMTTGIDDEFLKTVEEIQAETGVVIRLNQSFRRTAPLSEIRDRWQKFRARPLNRLVVGIDILDNEEIAPALEKGQELYGSALADGRWHRTMHAGELGDIRNPRDAMIMGSERLGHGVNLAKDPIALEYAARTHEPVEINISSNLRLTDVPDVRRHPFLDYLRLGLPVSLSTDDEGIFDTDINRECELAVGQTDVTYAEMKSMAFHSITTSFAAEADKKTLLTRLTSLYQKFESTWPMQQSHQP